MTAIVIVSQSVVPSPRSSDLRGCRSSDLRGCRSADASGDQEGADVVVIVGQWLGTRSPRRGRRTWAGGERAYSPSCEASAAVSQPVGDCPMAYDGNSADTEVSGGSPPRSNQERRPAGSSSRNLSIIPAMAT